MAELRRTSRDRVGADGQPVVARGYDVLDDGQPREPARLRPHDFDEIAVVDVEPATAEERQALAFPAFALDRDVTLYPVDREGATAVEVRDARGERRAGWVAGADAGAVAALLEGDADLTTWVCWEDQHDIAGRVGLKVALSRPHLRPQPLGPPSRSAGAPGSARGAAVLRDQRVWVAVGLALVVLVVLLVTRL